MNKLNLKPGLSTDFKLSPEINVILSLETEETTSTSLEISSNIKAHSPLELCDFILIDSTFLLSLFLIILKIVIDLFFIENNYIYLRHVVFSRLFKVIFSKG